MFGEWCFFCVCVLFFLKGFNTASPYFCFLKTEYPMFVKEPPTHISAEMEKVVDIPCQARGERLFFQFAAAARVKEQKE